MAACAFRREYGRLQLAQLYTDGCNQLPTNLPSRIRCGLERDIHRACSQRIHGRGDRYMRAVPTGSVRTGTEAAGAIHATHSLTYATFSAGAGAAHYTAVIEGTDVEREFIVSERECGKALEIR